MRNANIGDIANIAITRRKRRNASARDRRRRRRCRHQHVIANDAPRVLTLISGKRRRRRRRDVTTISASTIANATADVMRDVTTKNVMITNATMDVMTDVLTTDDEIHASTTASATIIVDEDRHRQRQDAHIARDHDHLTRANRADHRRRRPIGGVDYYECAFGSIESTNGRLLGTFC
jgi:hypothetical protein